MTEFEQWLYEFKRLYREYSGPPTLPYATLRRLMDEWHEGRTPAETVELVRGMLKKEA